jgi:hypothetical protein
MKKILSYVLISMLVFASGVHSQQEERADVVESFTPSQAILFMKTSRIKNFIESLGFVAANLLPQAIAAKFTKIREELKNKTGIDLLDMESLEKAGLDTSRTASLALYPSGRRNERRIIVFIPVKNEQTFPLKFVEILKKMSGGENLDLFPVVTEYRNRPIYQIQKDIFSTAFEGVFILTSTGELIRGVIDVKENNSGYLSLDPLYIDYTGRAKKNYDLRAFAARDFLKKIVHPGKKPDDTIRKEKKDGAPPKDKADVGPSALNGFNPALLRYVADGGGGKEGMKKSNKSESEKFFEGPALLNSVDYASMGVTIKPADIDIDLSARFNKTDERVNTFLDFIKTGLIEKALFFKDAATFAYFSIDCNKIEELCRDRAAGCAYYFEFKNEIREELGIDFEKEFIPYHSGVFNIIAGQPKGSGGGYVIYLSMNDPGRNKSIYDAIAGHLKKKYNGTTRFGNSKIAGVESIWYIDSKNARIHIAHDSRGMYMGNDTELMSAALTARTVKEAPAGDDLIKKLGAGVFFLASIKKESFFGALIMLHAYRSKEIGPIVDKMTDLYVVGEKIENYLTLAVTIKLAKRR